MGFPACREALIPGTLLAGQYRLERVLGSGGMGIVYAARRVRSGSLGCPEDHGMAAPGARLAVKLLHPWLMGHRGAVMRFFREAEVTMRLRGEHVVRVHEVDVRPDGVPFLVMDHLSGIDLGLLRRGGPVAVSDAVHLLMQACAGLSQAHRLGIVHRDVKPANLFMAARPDGSPCIKVIDFGISKVIRDGAPPGAAGDVQRKQEDADDACAAASKCDSDITGVRVRARAGEVTGRHAILGSPPYMAPEQLKSARAVDARADVWALGVILYELLAGTRPFEGDAQHGLTELRTAILENRPRPLRVFARVPSGLEAVIERCLAKDPAERFPDASALSSAIAPFASAPFGRAAFARMKNRAMRPCKETRGSSGLTPLRGGPMHMVRSDKVIATDALTRTRETVA